MQTIQPESNVIPITAHRGSVSSPEKFKARNFAESVGFALNRIARLVKTERNFRIHLVIMGLVLSVGCYFQLKPTEWIILTVCIGLMLAVEALNTAIEATVDLMTGGIYHEMAKHAKDTAAGACLIMAFSVSIVGACVFLPHLWQKLQHFF